VFEDYVRFFGPPNIGAHRVSAEKQLTMPPQKRSKKNTPVKTDPEEHHHVEGNGISLTLNLQTSQTKSKEQNLRLSKEQELRRQHTFKNSLQNNRHMKMI
jgi:hypothetical protein